MPDEKHPGFEAKYVETTLQSVIDYYVKGFDKQPFRHKFYINPYDQKVIIELFMRKEQGELRKDSQGVEQ